MGGVFSGRVGRCTGCNGPVQASWLGDTPYWLAAAQDVRSKQCPSFQNMSLADRPHTHTHTRRWLVYFVFPVFCTSCMILKGIVLFKRGTIADKEVGRSGTQGRVAGFSAGPDERMTRAAVTRARHELGLASRQAPRTERTVCSSAVVALRLELTPHPSAFPSPRPSMPPIPHCNNPLICLPFSLPPAPRTWQAFNAWLDQTLGSSHVPGLLVYPEGECGRGKRVTGRGEGKAGRGKRDPGAHGAWRTGMGQRARVRV